MLENSFLKKQKTHFAKGINQERITFFLLFVILKLQNMTKTRKGRLAEADVGDELSDSFCFPSSL